MKKIEWILLTIIVPLGELHKLWQSSDYDVDVFLFRDYKLNIEWVIKDCSEMAQFSIMTYIGYRLGQYAPIRKSVKEILLALFLFSILDFVLYFMDHKTGLYGIAFYIIAFFVIFNNQRKR